MKFCFSINNQPLKERYNKNRFFETNEYKNNMNLNITS